eukprot:2604403-Pyramimonas_sp.AAC.1
MVWSRGDGRGRVADPPKYPFREQLARMDYQPVEDHERVRTEEGWENLAPNHYLKILNREWRGGGPASPGQEDAGQPESDEAAGSQVLAGAVDPTVGAAPGPDSDHSDTDLAS